MNRNIELDIQNLQTIINNFGTIKLAVEQISVYLDSYESVPIEITNYLKSVVQKEALEAWKANNYRGIIVMATGTGKSKIVIDWFKELYQNWFDELRIPRTIYKSLIVVPTETLRDVNWKNEFEKWNQLKIYNITEKLCYKSLGNLSGNHYDTIVLDEAHHVTEDNTSFVSNNTYNRIMLLTATYPRNKVKQRLLKSLDIVYELPLDIAVKLRLISPYEIVIVETELDKETINCNGGTKKNPKPMSEFAAYQKINNTANRMMYNVKPIVLKMQMLKRMRFIYNLSSKTEVAKTILMLLNDENNPERTLIFCGSIEQANKLSPFSYHSKTTDEYLNKFINEEINELSCVEALNEGINIPSVDNGLLVQVNSNERQTIQRIGRILRRKEGHIGKLIIICANGTKDVDWVNKAIVNLDSTKVRRIKFQDLIDGIEKL